MMEGEVKENMENLKRKLDEKVLNQSDEVVIDVDERFGKMVSSITKRFVDKIAQVSQITGGFETLTNLQLKEWKKWRQKFAQDMEDLKVYFPNGKIALGDDESQKSSKSDDVEDLLENKLGEYSQVLDGKLKKIVTSITKDFEGKMKDVIDVIRNFQNQTQTQMNELNQWRSRFESNVQEMRQQLALPYYPGSNESLGNSTEIVSKPVTGYYGENGSITEEDDITNTTILAVLDELREKIISIQSKVNAGVACIESGEMMYAQDSDTEFTNAKNDVLAISDNETSQYIENYAEPQSKIFPTKVSNILPTSEYGVKKFCGHLTEIEDLIGKEKEIGFLKYALVRVGANDMENKNGFQIFEEVTKMVNVIREKYSDVVVILSEVMSRNDGREDDVKKCNELINKHYKNMKNVFIRKVTCL